MSQHPDEQPRSGAGSDDFESGLDYGAYTSEEADFPEDHLTEEEMQAETESAPPQEQPAPSAEQQSGPADPQQPHADEQPAAAPHTQDEESAATGVPSGDQSATRSLSEELAAARTASTAGTSRSAESPAPAADDQPTVVVPPAAAAAAPAAAPQQAPAQHTTAPPEEAVSPRHQQVEQARHSAPQTTAVAASDEDITDADIDAEVAKSKRGISRFFTVLVAIFTPILLVVGALRIVGSPVFLWLTYRRPGFPDDVHGFSVEERTLYGSYGMDFLFNLANGRYLSELVGPDGEALFTSSGEDLNEVSHMIEVKELIWIAMLLGLLLLALALLFALFLRSWRPGGFARGVFAGAWAALGLLIGLTVLAFLDWRTFFAEFHHLLFSGNWQFPDDYALIRLYPNQFWIDAGIWMAALVLVFSLVALLITWPTKRRRARRAERLAEVHQRRREKLIDELNSASA